MSPDTREHRGPHPSDREIFADEQIPPLRIAITELSWLLSHGYKLTSSLKLVGDRYRLTERQRLAVSRSACSDAAMVRRKDHCVSLKHFSNEDVIIDGFNLIISIEAALSGHRCLFAVTNASAISQVFMAPTVLCRKPRALSL